MLNLQGMTRAPRLTWIVTAVRKRCGSAHQNGRQMRLEIQATDDKAAKFEFIRQYPEFWVTDVRRKP
jgi:hypothetical protein